MPHLSTIPTADLIAELATREAVTPVPVGYLYSYMIRVHTFANITPPVMLAGRGPATILLVNIRPDDLDLEVSP